MIKLENKHQSYFNCFEDCIASVVNYYGKDYMNLFCESWRVLPVSYNIEEEKGNYGFGSSCHAAEKYCGLAPKIKTFHKYEDLKAYTVQCIGEKRPVIFLADQFDLPWSEYYKKIHNFHYLIIFDYLEDNMFQVMDGTKQIDSVMLDLNSAYRHGTITVVLYENGIHTGEDTEYIIRQSKLLLENDVEVEKYYELLYHLINHYREMKDSIFNLPAEDVETEDVMNYLLDSGRGRTAFGEFLTHITGKTENNYREIARELKYSGAGWLTLRKKLMKVRFKENWNDKKEEFLFQFEELLDRDQKLYKKYIDINDFQSRMEEEENDLETLSQEIVDLYEYFDSNGFNSLTWKNDLGFDQAGYYYELDRKEAYYQEKNCHFTFALDRPLDNISCSNQIITINRKDVKAIMIIGSCENGDYVDKLHLIYDEGNETADIAFPDWWESGRYGEKIIKKTNCCRQVDGEVRKMGEVSIFGQLVRAVKGSKHVLESIRLPDCPNMHIFGLALYY